MRPRLICRESPTPLFFRFVPGVGFALSLPTHYCFPFPLIRIDGIPGVTALIRFPRLPAITCVLILNRLNILLLKLAITSHPNQRFEADHLSRERREEPVPLVALPRPARRMGPSP